MIALGLALLALVLWLLAQLFDNLALNKRKLDEKLARIYTAELLAKAGGWLILLAGIAAYIDLVR